jgi:hypothetical protein
MVDPIFKHVVRASNATTWPLLGVMILAWNVVMWRPRLHFRSPRCRSFQIPVLVCECGCVWIIIILANIKDCTFYLYFVVRLLEAVAKLTERVNHYVNEHRSECILWQRCSLIRAYLKKSYVVGGLMHA